MQKVCTDMLKEGVLWDDVHLTAHKIAIDGLLALGILQGDKEDILETRTRLVVEKSRIYSSLDSIMLKISPHRAALYLS